VSTAGANLQVAAPSGVKTAPLAAVDDIRNPAEQLTWERLQHPRLTELWTGFFDLGFALARGNARAENFTMAFNAARVTRHDKTVITFNQIRGSARVNGITSTVANAVRGGWLYNRDVTRRFFIGTFNDYEYDQFQDLDLRFVLGGGFGVNAIKTPRASLSISGGGDYQRENFTNRFSRNSGEVNFGDEFLYKISTTSNFTQAFRFFPNLTNTGEYRINFDMGDVTTIRKWLSWHLTASDRFLSNPVFGRQRNDLIVTTGIRISFGTGK
jgi:putative salt-induced outer membrane protein